MRVSPGDSPTTRLDHAWIDVPEAEIVAGRSRTAITGLSGHVRQVAAYADGWIVRAHGLYAVDRDGTATQLMRRRPTEGFVRGEQGRVAIQSEGPGPREHATVFDAATDERVGRYDAHDVKVLDHHQGQVWLSVRDTRADRSQLVLWDPETGTVERRHRFGLDGLDAEHGVAWRMKRHRTSFFPLTNSEWSRWSARHDRFVTPAVSPDGRHVVTHTQRGEEPDYPYAGSMVVRELETGDAVIDFRGRPHAEPFWVSDTRFVSQYFRGADSYDVAQMRLGLGGGQSRVSPFAEFDVKRVLVGAPQPILGP